MIIRFLSTRLTGSNIATSRDPAACGRNYTDRPLPFKSLMDTGSSDASVRRFLNEFRKAVAAVGALHRKQRNHRS